MKTYTKVKAVAVIAALASAFLFTSAANAGKNEQKVQLSDCPSVVQDVIKDKAEGGQILEIEKSTKKDGTIVYEAEVKKPNGKKMDVEVAADGTLLKVDDEADEESGADDNDSD